MICAERMRCGSVGQLASWEELREIHGGVPTLASHVQRTDQRLSFARHKEVVVYRRISIPLDGTTESQQALAVAVAIARKCGCPIDLLRVAPPALYNTELYGAAALAGVDAQSMRRDAEESLRGTTAEVERLGVSARSIVLDGEISPALAEHLQTSDTDLVVMTTHDRGRLEHLLLGSTAESLMRRVHLPMLLVRAGKGSPPLAAAPSLERMLIPLDGSPFGDQVITHAATLAELMGAEITLLTIVQPILVAAAATEIGAPPSVALPTALNMEDADRIEIESRVLSQSAASLRDRGLKVDTAAVADGNPARAIVEFARKHAFDLIAMTTHGRGALKRLIAGSVSEEVLRTTPTLMLMYRPDRSASARH